MREARQHRIGRALIDHHAPYIMRIAFDDLLGFVVRDAFALVEIMQVLGIRFVVVLDRIDNIEVKAEAQPGYGALSVIAVT